MSWTGGKDQIDKATGRYSYHYQCNRKNRKKYTTICPVIPIPARELEDYVVDFVRNLLSDPKAAYEYQKELSSKRLNVEKIKRDKHRLTEMQNALPQIRSNLLKQHEMGYIDSTALKEKDRRD